MSFLFQTSSIDIVHDFSRASIKEFIALNPHAHYVKESSTRLPGGADEACFVQSVRSRELQK